MLCSTEKDMVELGQRIGKKLQGGMCVELIGDVGAGKTTLTKGIGQGLDADDVVQSPSFTISREYICRDGLRMAHYDFYRLHDAGVLAYELAESLADPEMITIVEWAQTIQAVLPDNRIVIRISSHAEGEARDVTVEGLDL